jgi:hypothetical protein
MTCRVKGADGKWRPERAWGDVLDSEEQIDSLELFVRTSEGMTDFAFHAEFRGRPLRKAYAAFREKGCKPFEASQHLPRTPRGFLEFAPHLADQLYHFATQALSKPRKEGWTCACGHVTTFDEAASKAVRLWDNGDVDFVCGKCQTEQSFLVEYPKNPALVIGPTPSAKYADYAGCEILQIRREGLKEMQDKKKIAVDMDGLSIGDGYKITVQGPKGRRHLRPRDLSDLDVRVFEQDDLNHVKRAFTKQFMAQFCAAFAEGLPIYAQAKCTYIGRDDSYRRVPGYFDGEQPTAEDRERAEASVRRRYSNGMTVTGHMFKLPSGQVQRLYFVDGTPMPEKGTKFNPGDKIANALGWKEAWNVMGQVWAANTPRHKRWGDREVGIDAQLAAGFIDGMGHGRAFTHAKRLKGFLQQAWFNNQGRWLPNGNVAFPQDLLGPAAGQVPALEGHFDVSNMKDLISIGDGAGVVFDPIKLRRWDDVRFSIGGLDFDGAPRDPRYYSTAAVLEERATQIVDRVRSKVDGLADPLAKTELPDLIRAELSKLKHNADRVRPVVLRMLDLPADFLGKEEPKSKKSRPRRRKRHSKK